jgi:hypothetical protein
MPSDRNGLVGSLMEKSLDEGATGEPSGPPTSFS